MSSIKAFECLTGHISGLCDSKGQKLVKKFSNNMLNMEAVLTDASSKELARLTKVFSADGKDISSTVVYGE